MNNHLKYLAISKKKVKITASLLMVILLTLPPLVNVFVLKANAAALTEAKVLINNSQAGASGVSYNFRFTAPATTNIGRWVIQFCTTASGACSTPSGMTTTTAVRANDNFAGTGRTDTFNSNGTLDTDITTPAAQSTQSIVADYTTITNPSTVNTTYYARITTYQTNDSTVLDTATVAFAVLDTTSIAVSATVDPNFTFTVAGVASGGTVNGATTTVTAGNATIPFATLTAGTPAIAAHDITISTNAGSGYSVTASHSGTTTTAAPLNAGSNNIDRFSSNNDSPTVWSEPAGTSANSNTGYFGYTTNDSSLCTGTQARFTDTGNEWAGTTTVGQEVACNTQGASETTRVGWQVEVNAVQPAGSYTGTAILVATPTY